MASVLRMEEIRKLLLQNEGGAVLYNRDHNAGLAYLELNNPSNTITGSMMVALSDAVEDLQKWQVGKAVIICSSGDDFCTGIDNGFAVSTTNPTTAHDMSYWMSDTLSRLRKLPFLTLCVLTGTTESFGAEIPLYCDYVLMTHDATISYNHSKMGITPGWGGGARLWGRVGKKMAMDLLLTAKVLSAEDAVGLGIADGVVGVEAPLENALNFLLPRIQGKPVVVQAIKKMNCCSDTPITAYESVFERNAFSMLWSGPVYASFLSESFLSPSSSSEEEN